MVQRAVKILVHQVKLSGGLVECNALRTDGRTNTTQFLNQDPCSQPTFLENPKSHYIRYLLFSVNTNTESDRTVINSLIYEILHCHCLHIVFFSTPGGFENF